MHKFTSILFKTVVFVHCIFIFSFCSSPEKKKGDRLSILTTTQIIADGVKNIVGDKADVISLMGSGVDPHLYKAAQSDMQKLSNADVIISNGLHLEGKMADVLHKYGKLKPVFEVSEGMDASLFRQVGNNTPDPHLWFNVAMWKSGLEKITKVLQENDAKNSELYLTNWQAYATRLDSIDEVIKENINQIPEKQRVLVTAHDAFGYYAMRYGMEVKSLQGLSTLANPGLKDIAELIDFIIERNIKAVFAETSVPEKNIRVLVDACKSKGHELVVGGSLYSDALGTEGTYEGTYEGAILKNTDLIVNSLK